MLNSMRSKLGQKVYQTCILVPYLISMVVVSYIVFAMLSTENGVLNKSILSLFGLKPISWYTQAKYWPVILVVVYLWKNFGYNSIIYYATVIGIDTSLYEAAAIDGANRWETDLACDITGTEKKQLLQWYFWQLVAYFIQILDCSIRYRWIQDCYPT